MDLLDWNQWKVTEIVRCFPFGRCLHKFASFVLRLHNEIENYYKEMLPRGDEHRVREGVVQRIAEVAESVWNKTCRVSCK